MIDDFLIPGRHQLEEQVGRFGVEWNVADLVDDDQAVAGDLAQLGFQSADAVRFGQAADPPGGRGERDPVSGLGGGDRQRGRQMSLAGAGWAEQDDVAGFGEPAATFQSGDLSPVDGRLGGEVEVGDRLDRREPGIPDTLACSGFGAGIGFHRQYRSQVVLQRPVRSAALLGQPLVMPGDPRGLQQSGLVGDQLVHLTGCRGAFWWPSGDLPGPERTVVGAQISDLNIDLEMTTW